MRTPLWIPSVERKEKANITNFIDTVNRRRQNDFKTYADLYQWSVEQIPDFWAELWDFAEIKYSRRFDTVVDDLSRFPGARWFPGRGLNFAENLLRYRDNRTALIFRGETQKSARMTYAELNIAVARLAKSLGEAGVGMGDRVAGYMPNMMETVIGMLAASSLGAIWASCATDIGAPAALERLGQVEPKVLITADGYYYKGKIIETLANAAEVARGIPTLEKTVVVSYIHERADITPIPNSVHYDDFVAKAENLEI